MQTLSVSRIMEWRACRKRYFYSSELQLTPNERPTQFASGSAIHAMIEDVLQNRYTREMVGDAAADYLHKEFSHHEYPDEQVAKYLPGVVRAFNKVPEWVWGEDWHVEEQFNHHVQADNCRDGVPLEMMVHAQGDCDCTVVHMKPDLYRVTDDTVHIVDFKTGENPDIESYLTWNPQLDWYALGCPPPGKQICVRV